MNVEVELEIEKKGKRWGKEVGGVFLKEGKRGGKGNMSKRRKYYILLKGQKEDARERGGGWEYDADGMQMGSQ
jgi:hypothetical protein